MKNNKLRTYSSVHRYLCVYDRCEWVAYIHYTPMWQRLLPSRTILYHYIYNTLRGQLIKMFEIYFQCGWLLFYISPIDCLAIRHTQRDIFGYYTLNTIYIYTPIPIAKDESIRELEHHNNVWMLPSEWNPMSPETNSTLCSVVPMCSTFMNAGYSNGISCCYTRCKQ